MFEIYVQHASVDLLRIQGNNILEQVYNSLSLTSFKVILKLISFFHIDDEESKKNSTDVNFFFNKDIFNRLWNQR